MTNDQSQKSGTNSTNIQAQNITVNQGLTYSEAKEIALDVFKTNFLIFKEEAKEVASQRAEEITSKFVETLKERKPDSIQAVKDPGFQSALFEAQKNYVKTGDRDLADVLIDVLVERIENVNRDLKQIVLDESISIIPKLTAAQLDSLTIVFLIKYSKSDWVENHQIFKFYLEKNIKPFTTNLSKNASLYQHLEYTGCGSIGIGEASIEGIFSQSYKGLFLSGFDKENFETQIGKIEDYSDITTKCLNQEDRLQINAINEDVLEIKLKEKGFNNEIITKIKALFNNNLLPTAQIKEKILALDGGFMKSLYDVWENSFLKNMTLTSVGIAIAQANFRRKTGMSIDLSIWIK